jgi:SOS-response transcriptional repressor LexA
MIGDHIQDGDLILVSPQAEAGDGTIVVATIDGETTVKRLYRMDDDIHLMSSHPAMKTPLICRESELRIIGRVIAVLRFLEPAFSFISAPTKRQESKGDTLHHQRRDKAGNRVQ